jgi:hypothetical protein
VRFRSVARGVVSWTLLWLLLSGLSVSFLWKVSPAEESVGRPEVPVKRLIFAKS